MNPRDVSPATGWRPLAVLIAFLAIVPRGAVAADIAKANNVDALNLTTSWAGGVAPTSADVGVWNGTVTGSSTVAVGANLSWQGLRLDSANPPGGPVTLIGANSLTLGTAGLDVGATNLTWSSSSNFIINGSTAAFAGTSTVTLGGAATKNWGNTGVGISTVTFTGTLALRGGTGTSGNFSNNWVAFGRNDGVSQTGAFHLDTGASLTDRGEIIVTQGWGDGTGGRSKLTLASLTGFGDFRSDYGSNTIRTVLVDQSTNTTYQGRIVSNTYNTRAINLEKAGTGTLELTGGNTINSTAVNAGTLKVSGSGTFGTGRPLSVASGATFEWARDAAVTSAISGAGTIRRSTTTGNAAFSGSNTAFTGNWVVTAGFVGLTDDSTVGAANVGMTLDGGGIYFTTTGQTLAAGRTITLGPAGGTLNGSTGQTATFASTFTGTGGLQKVSGATAILTGVNDFTGGIVITAGTLEVGGAGKLGGPSGQYAGQIAVGDADTLTFSTSADQQLSGVVSGAGTLVKSGSGRLTLAAANTYSGPTTVSAGTLLINGAIGNSSAVSIAAGATLGGSGSINATLTGAGLVSPGNSPGITTATAVDPSAGMSYGLEFTATGSPSYGNASASVNDVLRLTGSTTPFAASLSGGNAVDVYFDVASLSASDTFKGGFYSDVPGDFLSSVQNGTYAYWVKGNGTGTDRTFNGQGYFSLATYDPTLFVTLSTVAETANFASGTINGQVTQFVVVPEPGTVGLVGAGICLAGLSLLRLRR